MKFTKKIRKKKDLCNDCSPKTFSHFDEILQHKKINNKKKKQLNTLLFPSILTNYFDKKKVPIISGRCDTYPKGG